MADIKVQGDVPRSSEEKCYESEAKFKFLFNNGNDAIFFHELDGNFIEVNDVACRNLGYSRHELMNMSVLDLNEPDPKIVQDIMHYGFAVGEVIHRCKDGSLLPVELSSRLIHINGKQMVLSIVRDIGERKSAQEKETHYREKLEILYKDAKHKSIMIEATNKIISVMNTSLKFQKVIKIFAEETYNLFQFDEMVIALKEEPDEHLLERHRITWDHRGIMKTDQPCKISAATEPYATVLKSGIPRIDPIEREKQCMNSCIIVPITFKDKRVGTFSLHSKNPAKYCEKDLSFLLNLAEHLAIALQNARLHKQVQEMAIMVERNRLAREIHDSTLQILGYFRAKGELLEKLVEKGQCEACLKISKEIQKVAVEAYNDTHEAIYSLSGQMQSGQGLEAALQDYLLNFSQRWNYKVNFVVHTPFPYLERDIELQLLRVVQEALANVRKHSGALFIQITAHQVDGGYAIDIEDNGVGFDSEVSFQRSFGLKVMNERMVSISGSLVINSEKGKGTYVRAWVSDREK